MKKTKILATLGPSSLEKKVISKMMEAGMDAVRINLSHGDLLQYEKAIKNVRSIKDIPIVLDTQGPEMRIFCGKEFPVSKGEVVDIGFDNSTGVYFNLNMHEAIKVGDMVLIEDGLMKTKVVSKTKNMIAIKALNNGRIYNEVKANIPTIKLHLPILTDEDKEYIRFGIDKKVDYVALSFTRTKEDVLKVRDFLKGTQIGIISKIETEEGVANFDEILEASDGIMVARGDLGVEVRSERLPLLQKEMIRKCNIAGKVVITATQMLQSMVSSPVPTRAETSDVANAILDGTDVIMLSGETAVGKYPILAIKEMAKISLEVEPHIKTNVMIIPKNSVSEAISKSIHEMTGVLPITKIVTFTRTGYTARLISRFRLNMEIIAVTYKQSVRKKLALYYGVTPITYPEAISKDRIKKCTTYLHRKKQVHEEDLVLYTAGVYSGEASTTNMLEIHKASDILRSK